MATLVSVLQVFIKEPLLDWTKDANAPDPDYGVDGALCILYSLVLYDFISGI